MYTYRQPAPEVTGYPLNECADTWAVIVPEATTNLILNPSFETDAIATIGATDATVEQSSDHVYSGAYSMKITPINDIFIEYLQFLGLTAGLPYTLSVWIRGVAGKLYSLELGQSVDPTAASLTEVIGIGRWQRLAVTYVAVTTGIADIIRLRSPHVPGVPFYTDAWQCEQKTYATTYCDGDMHGFLTGTAEYYWVGERFVSASMRLASTRSGGRVVPLASLGYRVSAFIGLGSTLLENIAAPRANGGAVFQDSQFAESTVSLVGAYEGASYSVIERQRGELQRHLSPNIVPVAQPLVLQYTSFDGERQAGDTVSIACHWQPSGGETTNNHQARVSYTFQLFLPRVTTIGGGSALAVQSAFEDNNFIAHRGLDGVWDNMEDGTNNAVQRLLVGTNQVVYAAGSFTTVGPGATPSAYFARYYDNSWSTVGTPPNNTVDAIVEGPEGFIYVAGNFTAIGGVAANRVSIYNPAGLGSWSGGLGTGINGQVYALTIGQDGTLYAGGNFTTAGGGGAVNLAKWNGSAWSAMGTGTNGIVTSLATGEDGLIYIGGSFTAANGVAHSRIVRYNPLTATFSAMGTGMNNTVKALAAGNGGLYAAGLFTTAGGVTVNYVAFWNGSQWRPLGTGFALTADPLAITVMQDGTVFVGGSSLVEAGGLPLIDGIAFWNGSTWLPADINIAGSSMTVFALAQYSDGSLIIGTAGTGTGNDGIYSGITTVTSRGSGNAKPIVTLYGLISGTARIYQLLNTTTGSAVYFNLLIYASEVITLDFEAQTFTSSTRGVISGTIINSSDTSNWHLQPGENTISLFASDEDVTATIAWRDNLRSLDDAAWGVYR